MTGKREYTDYLWDIVGAIEKVERFTEGMDLKQFSADDKTVFAVTKALEVIGEAVRKIPSAVRKQNPEIPWREIAGIRDKLVHEYFGVNLVVVWKTVQQDIPILKPLISNILQKANRQ